MESPTLMQGTEMTQHLLLLMFKRLLSVHWKPSNIRKQDGNLYATELCFDIDIGISILSDFKVKRKRTLITK